MQKLICIGLFVAFFVVASNASCPDVTGQIYSISSLTGKYYLKLETNRSWFLPKKCTVNEYTAEDSSVSLAQSYRYTWFLLNLFSLSTSYTVVPVSGGTGLTQTQTSGWIKSSTSYTVIASASNYLVLYTCDSTLFGNQQKTLVLSPSNTDLSDTDLTTIKTALTAQSLSTDLKTHPQTC